MLISFRCRARVSCRVTVYSNQSIFGMSVVSRSRRNSDIFLKNMKIDQINITSDGRTFLNFQKKNLNKNYI